MKTKIILLSLFVLTNFYAQIGINTTTPNASLDVVGNPSVSNSLDGIIPPRLTGDQLGQKTYTNSQTGAIVYVTLGKSTSTNSQVTNVKTPGLYQFDGTFWIPTISKITLLYGNLGSGVTGQANVNQFTGSSITLLPGKWLVTSQQLIKMTTNPSSGGSYWIMSSFSDSNTVFNLSSDIIGAPFISASIVGASQYNMMNGAIRINNNTSLPKTYYYWKTNGGFAYGTALSTITIDKFGGNAWAENIIYAIPYVD